MILLNSDANSSAWLNPLDLNRRGWLDTGTKTSNFSGRLSRYRASSGACSGARALRLLNFRFLMASCTGLGLT